MKVDFIFNEQTKVSEAVIKYKNETFIGTAKCHPDDLEFATSITGYDIAYIRAYIKYLKYSKKVYQDKLNTYKNLLKAIESCKLHNKKSYEYKYIKKQLNETEEVVDIIKSLISDFDKNLTTLLKEKDRLFNKIREIRARENNNK